MTPLADRLFDALARRGAGVALDSPDGQISGNELVSQADRAARALRADGLRPFAPVPVDVDNRPADIVALLAVYRAGGVAVPIHRSTPAPRRAGILEQLRPSAMLDGASTVVFTSGSSGTPKGVVLRADRQAAKLTAIGVGTRWPPGRRTLLALQLSFSFGQWVAWLTLLSGGVLVFPRRLAPDAVAERLSTGGVDCLPAVPTLLRGLLGAGLPPFSGAVLAGGEALSTVLVQQLRQDWPSASIGDIYGLTETGTCDFFVDPGDMDLAAGTLGCPADGISVRVAEDGELRINSPWGMAGYLDDPDRTAAAFDSDGFFRTGDLVAPDSVGRLRLIGRASDMINRGGLKVAPREVEDALAAHPSVLATLVAGFPEPVTGEGVAAAVVVRPGAAVDPDALRGWLGERLERYKVPTRILVVPALPVGGTGKADRGALRDLLRD